MKIIKRSVVLLISTVVLTAVSCEESSQTTKDTRKEIYLNLNHSGWDNSIAEFREGDKAGLFAVAGVAELSDERYADNEEFVLSGGKFVGMQDVRFANAESYMVIYTPYKPEVLAAGTQLGAVSVAKDQSNLYNYLASDFKLGSARVLQGVTDPVKATLKRMFSKVNLEIASTVLDGDDLQNAIAELEINTACNIDFGTQQILANSDPARIKPRGTFKSGESVYRGVSLIAVPQQFGIDDEFIHLTIRGEESAYALEKPIELLPGMEYTFSILVNNVGNKYRLDIDVTEEPWTAGDDLDFDIDQEADEIRPVSDIEGNEYKVVKVGAQYWMAANLRVTKYNDGSPITYLEDAKAWDKVSESLQGACCYYNTDQKLKEKYGLLYNWHAVKTGKLCPEGWHVPSQAEFKMLIDEQGGDQFAGEVLKSISGWRDYQNMEKPEFQGTNKSGFNGFPGGYRAPTGAYLNEGRFGYWWCSTTQEEFKGSSIYLYYNHPKTAYISEFFRAGYSVRCIKY